MNGTPPGQQPAAPPDVATLQAENTELRGRLEAAGLHLPEQVRTRVARGLPLDKARLVVARQPFFEKRLAAFRDQQQRERKERAAQLGRTA